MQHARTLLWHALLWLATRSRMPSWVWMEHYDIPVRQYTRVTDGGTEIRMVPPLPEPTEFQQGTHILRTQMADGYVPPCGRLVAGQVQPVEITVHLHGKEIAKAIYPTLEQGGGDTGALA